MVKYFRSLKIPGGRFCPDCGNVFHKHGILDGLNDEETICPGDYIVTHPKGHYYKLTSAEFERMFEPYPPPLPTPETPSPMKAQT